MQPSIRKRHRRTVCLQVSAVVVLGIALLYGALLLGIGWLERTDVTTAKAAWESTQVRVSTIQPSATNPFWYDVTLEPANPPHPDDPSQNPSSAPGIAGITCAATINRTLQPGSLLTMYYDPLAPEQRVVDFRTAGWFFTAGGVMCGIPVLAAIIWCICRKSSRHAPKSPTGKNPSTNQPPSRRLA